MAVVAVVAVVAAAEVNDMAGFLDSLKIDDPATAQGLLQFGLSLLQSKGNLASAIGAAGQQGLQGSQQYRQNAFQKQQQQFQLDQQKRQREMQNLPAQFMTGGMKPDTMDNRDVGQPGEAPIPAKQFDAQGYGQALMGLDPAAGFQFQQMTRKAAPELKTFKPGDVAGTVENGVWKQTLAIPDRPDAESLDPLSKLINARDKLPPGHPNRKSYDAAIMKATTHQPGTSVSVNTGQKGFDNTLKLRGDFRSEPIYKAHQEVQSAYAQIGQALKQASPAGDLAGATKIMKLLDPGSVVRESELGMAMAATGLMDRVQNYATNIMAGTKLTPAQRKDFQKLADALYGESVKQYSTKQAEYKGISERNGLNTADVVGNDQAAPSGFKYLGQEK